MIRVQEKESSSEPAQSTPRIERLRERLLHTDPIVCPERALIWTDSYRDNEDKPPILKAAIALKETLERMSIHINDDELIVGNQGSGLRSAPLHPQISTWFLDELDLFENRKASRFIVSETTKEKLKQNITYWEGKTVYERTMALLPEEAKEAMSAMVFTCNYTLQKGTGHFLLHFEEVLQKGFNGIRKKAEESLGHLDLSNPGDLDKITYCRAVTTVCESVVHFSQRYAQEAKKLAANESNGDRRSELIKIAEICSKVPANPARSYYEALQTVWFVQLISQIESDGTGVSLGRLDYILFPYYKRDVKERVITKAFAEELMDSLWLKLSEIIEVWPQGDTRFFGGHPISQTITLGGTHEDGTDSTNELTYMCLDTLAKLRFPQPSVCVRIHKDTPWELLVRCAEVARLGLGMPAFYNDEIAIPSLVMRGVKLEHARRNWGVAGCVEIGLQGQMCHFANSGYFSFLKVLELTLNNGIDPGTGKQLGLQTGNAETFKSFDDFFSAYKKQIKYFLNLMVGITNVVNTMHGEYVTLPFISTFTEDCLGRLKEVHDGGALYNHDGPQGVGLADTADSLAALKKLVFEDREIKIVSLLEALSSNFNGHEHIQHLLLRKAPKYGNNESYVDELARELSSFFCREVGLYRNPRGGNFVPGLYSVSANVPIGLYVGATPNGRTARSPVAEACSPVHGCDVNGPTQAALSVAHLDHVLATNGTQYNQKYHPGALEGTKGLQALVNLIRTFFAEGGYHIQFNVITAAKLRKAQKFPEKYRDLVIRVAGYSAFFVDLDETIQEDIIERTELEFH